MNQSIIEYLWYYKTYGNDTKLWFKRVNKDTGNDGNMATQYDLYAAYFSGVLLYDEMVYDEICIFHHKPFHHKAKHH